MHIINLAGATLPAARMLLTTVSMRRLVSCRRAQTLKTPVTDSPRSKTNSFFCRRFSAFCPEGSAHAHPSLYNHDVTDSSEGNLSMIGESSESCFEFCSRFQGISTHPENLLCTTLTSPTVVREARTHRSLSTKSMKIASLKRVFLLWPN